MLKHIHIQNKNYEFQPETHTADDITPIMDKIWNKVEYIMGNGTLGDAPLAWRKPFFCVYSLKTQNLVSLLPEKLLHLLVPDVRF